MCDVLLMHKVIECLDTTIRSVKSSCCTEQGFHIPHKAETPFYNVLPEIIELLESCKSDIKKCFSENQKSYLLIKSYEKNNNAR